MPFYFDPEHWTMRGAAAAGEPYTYSAQGQVQRDRSMYIYNAVGQFPAADALEAVAQIRALAKLYNWTEILWERRRKNGLVHVARIPIIANSQ